ncbi:MAG: endonuclease MutS2 [Rudaea sp.]
MNARHFRPLEFDKIRTRLAGYASFAASEELALALEPSVDPAEVHLWQQETTEARNVLDQQPSTGIGGARDVRPLVRAAEIGATLNPPDFLDIRATLVSARSLRRNLSRLNELFPRLSFIAGGLEDLPSLDQAIARVLNDRAEVVDGASPALARVRGELNVVRSRMMERLQRMLTSPEVSKWLQDPIITQRDGRYVIPVRAEARGRIKGIVHDASASGATLFIEPLHVVEAGNRVRELEIEEQREVERILRELTGQVAASAESLTHTVETLAQLDLAFAKARFSADTKSIEPKIIGAQPVDQAPGGRRPGETTEGRAAIENRTLILKSARHPLLDPEKVVPISVELGRSFSILIITGPNTGGKTVTLKTVGLLALMAQSGLHIPAAEGSQLPVYKGIYADIGDEQSIEQSLSTFSSHMTNIVEILREAGSRSLVLLDELGAGTDPVEGSALARSIITSLLNRKISALVATHFAELKAFAQITPGVENASMEFDVATLAPTFHLTIGLPGRSNAFAIARRLGLDPQIIDSARSSLTRTDVELEKLLAEIKHTREETTRELSRAEAERERAEKAAEGARKRLAEIERSRGDILREARLQAQGEVEAARQELYRLRQEWRKVSVTRDYIEQAEEDLEAVQKAARIEEPALPVPAVAPPPREGRIELGDRVYVPSLDQLGDVIGLADGGADVQIGSFRVHLDMNQLELRYKSQKQEAEPAPPAAEVVLPSGESPGVEVHLRGMRADEALDKLDKYLDRAYRAGLPYVRIVHGKGTGTLRRLVRDQLTANPLVSSYETALPNEGGEGVTVAKLVSR